MKPSVPWGPIRDKYLENMEGALLYLQYAMEGGDLAHFLDAFGNVVRAQGGISKFAEKTKLSRQTIHNILKNKDLRASNLWELMKTLGLRFDIVPLEKKAKKAPFAKSRKRAAMAAMESSFEMQASL